tara:strand:+ start:103 stop:444 length:342 start_codon:yes stop_codon:yes gene_type:complete
VGRFGVSSVVPGTVKSIQAISASRGSNGGTDVTITAVSATNKAYIVSNTTTASLAGYHDPVTRSGSYISPPSARLTSTTNVRVSCPQLDLFSDGEFGGSSRSAAFKAYVVEVH